MEPFWDDLGELYWVIAWTARWLFGWAVWVLTGKFMPDLCTWCRPFWMLGLAGVVVLGITHLRGPKK